MNKNTEASAGPTTGRLSESTNITSTEDLTTRAATAAAGISDRRDTR